MDRRNFILKSALTTAGIGLGQLSLKEIAAKRDLTKLTILHTNDMHSRIDPFPMDGGRNQGLGGVAKRAALIQKIRLEEPNVLLLDSGDIFQGTPYFNYFGGELELKLMSTMQYDAATIGNHDFDAGIGGLDAQLPNAQFPFICSNYDFNDTILAGKTKKYKIFQKGDLKIGVIGVGIELEGLVPKDLYKNTRYLDPISRANKFAGRLKNDLGCDYVICLSHLGFKYRNYKIDDIKFAKYTRNIDLILGGHTHTFLKKPYIQRNTSGKKVHINQAGWAGIVLGRVDVYFERSLKKFCSNCDNQLITN